TAEVWKMYRDQATIEDEKLAKILNSDLDPLLLFAGLFSAILSAFLIKVRKGLQEDLQDKANQLLTALVENQHNSGTKSFKSTSTSHWVNGLWFSSLMLSLISALGGTLAKGWITDF
ncbi:hypothetical protein B0H10DRAFT_1634221, partial [Mycena sp. CBHHK59/15]